MTATGLRTVQFTADDHCTTTQQITVNPAPACSVGQAQIIDGTTCALCPGTQVRNRVIISYYVSFLAMVLVLTRSPRHGFCVNHRTTLLTHLAMVVASVHSLDVTTRECAVNANPHSMVAVASFSRGEFALVVIFCFGY